MEFKIYTSMVVSGDDHVMETKSPDTSAKPAQLPIWAQSLLLGSPERLGIRRGQLHIADGPILTAWGFAM